MKTYTELRLLINLAVWRSSHIGQVSMEYAIKHADSLIFNDQDILNALLHDKKLLIPFRWNVQDGFLRRKRRIRPQAIPALLEDLKHPVIIHYTGHRKPWLYLCQSPYQGLYFKYQDMTDWKGMFKNKFVGLKSIVGIKSRRTIVATRETSEETRYYITSLSNDDPERIANAIRQHWSIENNLHWQLDITFREDESKKVKNAARNLSAISKIALSILKNDKMVKGSLNLKRLKAGWDEVYLSKLLEGFAI